MIDVSWVANDCGNSEEKQENKLEYDKWGEKLGLMGQILQLVLGF